MAADPVLWPVPGAGDVFWQAEWLTDVMRPVAGLAQHRQLREHPRLSIGFDGLSTATERRWLENLLEAHAASPWHVPLPGCGFRLGASLISGASGILGDTTGTLFQPGGLALITGADPRKGELVTIDEVEPDGLVLADDTVRAHAAGEHVLPVFAGMLAAAPQIARFTGDAAPWRVEFELTQPLPITGNTGATTYRGHPVLELPVDWESDPTWQPTRQLITEDNGTGPVYRADLLRQASTAFSRQATAANAQEVADLLARVWGLAGRATPIWVSTLAADLVPVASASSGGTTLDVAWCGLPAGTRPPGRRDIRIALRNGTVIRRRVTGVAQPDANTHRLALDSALGTAFAPDDVLQVSWLALCTLGADVVRINWWRYDVARCQLTFQQVAHEY